MKYIKKLIRNSKRALNQQVIKKKQEIVKYAPRLTGIQAPLGRTIFLFGRGGTSPGSHRPKYKCQKFHLLSSNHPFFCVFKNTYKKGFIEIFSNINPQSLNVHKFMT